MHSSSEHDDEYRLRDKKTPIAHPRITYHLCYACQTVSESVIIFIHTYHTLIPGEGTYIESKRETKGWDTHICVDVYTYII